MKQIRVADLSSYNKGIDWSKVKSIDGYIHRFICKSGLVDSSFSDNLKNATVPLVAVYVYSYMTSRNWEWYTEKIIKAYKDYNLDCDIILDIETASAWDNMDAAKSCASRIKKQLGKDVILYTNYSMYKQYKKRIPADWRVWIARYYLGGRIIPVTLELDVKKKPVTAHNLIGWQFTDCGQIDGIGTCDCSEWYVGIENGEIEVNNYPYPTRHYWYRQPIAMKSEEIKWIQFHLYRLGFLKTPKDINGKFDAKTRDAVIACQEYYGIDNHGVVESNTRYVLQFN